MVLYKTGMDSGRQGYIIQVTAAEHHGDVGDKFILNFWRLCFERWISRAMYTYCFYSDNLYLTDQSQAYNEMTTLLQRFHHDGIL